jgi:single-strand DNA-binding protein
MNSCVLMGTIISDPELRYTQEQLEISQMLLEFDPQQNDRTNNSPVMARLKVVGFGNLAKEVKEKYNQGDRVVVVGRLGMNTIERDGYKEKRAELSLSHIYSIGEGGSTHTSSRMEDDTSSDSSNQSVREKVVPINSHVASEPEYELSDANSYGYDLEEIPATEKNLDDIPF